MQKDQSASDMKNLDYYAEEAAILNPTPGDAVRPRVPASTSHCRLSDGTVRTPDVEGMIMVPAEHASACLGAGFTRAA